MKDPKLGVNLHYNYPMYYEFVQPKGALTLDRECHACFHYTKLAMRARYLAGSGPESQIIQYKVGETPPDWMESRDEEIARGVAIMYQLESPDEFLKFKKEAWTQATVFLGLPVNEEIYNVRPGSRRVH
jgi:hypothetical protein